MRSPSRCHRPLTEVEPAGPMAPYADAKGQRSRVGARWKNVACIVEADDGSFGGGLTHNSGPVLAIINDHFRAQLVGEPVLATEKCFDMMGRMSAAYGSHGLTSFAISAVDLALWDLKG
mgnify:CR=1 FL=1